MVGTTDGNYGYYNPMFVIHVVYVYVCACVCVCVCVCSHAHVCLRVCRSYSLPVVGLIVDPLTNVLTPLLGSWKDATNCSNTCAASFASTCVRGGVPGDATVLEGCAR